MGKKAIDEGNRDSWTITPKIVAAARPANRPNAEGGDNQARGGPAVVAAAAVGAAAAPADRPSSPSSSTTRQARRARLHPAGRSARFPHGDQVRQHAARHRRHRASRDGRLRRRRQEVSGRLLRREDGPGVSAARARHVRAAGSSQRFRQPADHADAALRHGRLDAGLSDGREVRPHSRRLRRPVRGTQGRSAAAAGARSTADVATRRFLPRCPT